MGFVRRDWDRHWFSLESWDWDKNRWDSRGILSFGTKILGTGCHVTGLPSHAHPCYCDMWLSCLSHATTPHPPRFSKFSWYRIFRLAKIVFVRVKMNKLTHRWKLKTISRLFNSFGNDVKRVLLYFEIFHYIRDSFLQQAFGGKGELIEEVSADLHSG